LRYFSLFKLLVLVLLSLSG